MKTIEPFGFWHVGATEDESDFFLFSDAGHVGCNQCVTLYGPEVMERIRELEAENEKLRKALKEIALAGMSGTGQETEEAMTQWHARQAYLFIQTAAIALTKADAAMQKEKA